MAACWPSWGSASCSSCHHQMLPPAGAIPWATPPSRTPIHHGPRSFLPPPQALPYHQKGSSHHASLQLHRPQRPCTASTTSPTPLQEVEASLGSLAGLEQLDSSAGSQKQAQDRNGGSWMVHDDDGVPAAAQGEPASAAANSQSQEALEQAGLQQLQQQRQRRFRRQARQLRQHAAAGMGPIPSCLDAAAAALMSGR